MPNLSKLEERTKIATEAKFATLGRAIADAAPGSSEEQSLIAEAALRRTQEQNAVDKLTRFAALARQIGYAAQAGKDNTELLAQIHKLRRQELGSTHPIGDAMPKQ